MTLDDWAPWDPADEPATLLGRTCRGVGRSVRKFPDTVLGAAAALRSGKHVILTGPPGTGTSTLATLQTEAALLDEFGLLAAVA
jgi:MoxR-like ATPase